MLPIITQNPALPVVHPRTSARLFASLVIASILLVVSTLSHAQTNLELNITGPTDSIESGRRVTLNLAYRCASTTQAAQNATLRVSIPAGLDYHSHTSSVHIASAVYNSATRELVYDFISPLQAGTTGLLEVNVEFPNGSSPNGLVRSVGADFTADNAASVYRSHLFTAKAKGRFNILKQHVGGGALGQETVWEVRICNAAHNINETGVLNVTSAIVTDYLPTGVTFVRFTGTDADVSRNYDSATRTVSFTTGLLEPRQCFWERFVVTYESSHFTVNQLVTNTANASATLLGGGTMTDVSSASINLQATRSESVTEKTVQDSVMGAGTRGIYSLKYNNIGTTTLDSAFLEDLLPYEVEFTEIRLGQWAQSTSPDPYFISFHYQTNLQPWRTHFSDIHRNHNPRITLDQLGLTLGGAEYVTGIRIGLKDARTNTNSYNPVRISFRIRDNTPSGIVENCAYGITTTAANNYASCVDFRVVGLGETSTGLEAEPAPWSWKNAFPSGPVNVGDVINFRAVMRNDELSDVALIGAEAYVLLPIGLTYIPGSLRHDPPTSQLGTPTMTATDNFDGTNRTLLKWVYPSGANSIEPGDQPQVYYDARVNSDAPPGYNGLRPEFLMRNSNPPDQINCQIDETVDAHDFDGDGDRSETFCSHDFGIEVASVVALSSQLSVKGGLDSDYSIFPDVGNTVPGGLADYKLVLKNEGNIAVTNVILLDILPSVGDVGVVTGDARDSRWRPSLIGPVEAPPGVTVYYSTATNPCREADGFINNDLAGCQAANWSLVLPDDLSSVNSMLFDFGSRILAQNAEFQLMWPMRTPTTVLNTANAGDAAWNSIGFVAERADNGVALLATEPLKTGITIAPLQPGVVGDRVWSDTNGNGLQDVGELGIGNVRVGLYRDNGDGTPDPLFDPIESFTNTNSDGSYLFPALPSGNYFLTFFLPPSVGLSPKQAGANTELDSDGDLSLLNGQEVAISGVFHITNLQQDLSRDLGLIPTGLSAISDYVWLDADEDGTQNEGANAGVNGVTLLLLDASNATIATTVSHNGRYNRPGYYEFDNLAAGNYRVQVASSADYRLVAKAAGGDVASDSDADPTTRRSELITLSANTTLINFDFGVVALPGEICTNGIDDDGDGLVDCDDKDCPGAGTVTSVTQN